MIKNFYARLVLWLIAPAIDEHARRKEVARVVESAHWKALGYPGGTWQAIPVLSTYWKDRGIAGGYEEARRRGLTGPDGKAIES